MGLFSTQKKIYVDSVVYNLAGDEDERPDYLKAVTIRGIMNRSPSLGRAINDSYLSGPGIKLRSFYRWAFEHFDKIGIPTGNLTPVGEISAAVLEAQLPHAAGELVSVNYAEIDKADYGNWAEQWMLANYPDEIDSAYTIDFNEDTNVITITRENGSVYTITPTNYDVNGMYLYVVYNTYTLGSQDPLVTGSTVTIPNADAFPDLSEWNTVSDVETQHIDPLVKTVRTVVTYSDGSPGSDTTVTTNSSETWYERHAVFQKRDWLEDIDDGSGGTQVKSQISTMHWDVTGTKVAPVVVTSTDTDMGGGVTKTTTVTTTTEDIDVDYTYRIDTQIQYENAYSKSKAYIYKIGGPNAALNALYAAPVGYEGEFFPVIPVRLNNRFVSDTYYPDLYPEAKKGYKKAMGASFDDLIEKIADNGHLGDIDYAFVVFGVSANVKEMECRKYLYEFFNNLKTNQDYDYDAWLQYVADYNAYKDSVEAYNRWIGRDHPTGGRAPVVLPEPKFNRYFNNAVTMSQNKINYAVTLQWKYISESFGIGLGKPDAKVGDCWFTTLSDLDLPVPLKQTTIQFSQLSDIWLTNKIQRVRLYWQTSANGYKYLDIGGMVHRNYVYKGKFTETTLKAGLADNEESGFIVPLHYNTFKETSLISSTQMATACCFMVFNCYKVVKIRWYQRGIFKILFVIVFGG